MDKRLFFICPTDHLESIINETFKQQNYFITSLGNSIEFDGKKVYDINELLDLKGIKKIFFALSVDNRVVLEALDNKCGETDSLQLFQYKLKRQKKYTQEVWQTTDPNFLALSCYLNDKIKELRIALSHHRMDLPKIEAVIYNRPEFRSVYSNLMHENNVSIN